MNSLGYKTVDADERALLAACFMLVSCLDYSSMGVVRIPSVTSIEFHRITRSYILEDMVEVNRRFGVSYCLHLQEQLLHTWFSLAF